MLNFFQLNSHSKSLIIDDTCQLQITIINSGDLEVNQTIKLLNLSSFNPNVNYYKWQIPYRDYSNTRTNFIYYRDTLIPLEDTLKLSFATEGVYIIYLNSYNENDELVCSKSVLLDVLDYGGCNSIPPVCEFVCNGDFEIFDGQISHLGNYLTDFNNSGMDGSGGLSYFLYGSTTTPMYSGSTDVFTSNNSWNGSYISNCPQINPIDVPNNIAGNQLAYSGSTYCGIHVYSANSNPNDIYREYIHQKLASPLIANETYFVSYAVSLADNSPYAIENVDLAFGHGLPNNQFSIRDVYYGLLGNSTSSGLPAQIIPDISNPNGILNNSTGWTVISGYYTAVGDERMVAVGNFYSDASTNATFLSNNTCLDNNGYYYIDKVSVKHILQPINLTASTQTVCQGQSVTLSTNAGFDFYTWSTGQSGATLNSITVTPLVNTTYTVTVFDPICGSNVSQTITIYVGSTNVDAGPDQTICPGAAVNLSATTTSTSNQTYEWFIGNNSVGQGQNINITPTVSPTIYTVVATDVASGCTASDNLTVNFYSTTPMTISAPNSSCCTNPNINVNPDYVNYFWSITPIIAIPGQGTDIITPVLDPNTSYDICLSAIDINGCKVEQCVHINSCCTPNDPIPSSGVQEFGKCSNGPLLISQIGINMNNNYFVFYQDLIIDQNTTFNNCNIRMAPGTTITVNANRTLIISQSKIKALCPEMWNGITVFNSSSTVQFTKSSEIWDAIDAVYSDNGGVYQITDHTQMVNNHRSLVVTNFTGTHPGYLENSDVYTSSTNLYPPYSGQRMYQGVYIANGGRVTIGRKVNFTNMDYGVYSVDANVDVYGNIFDKIDRPSNVNPCALCPAPVGTSIYAGTKIVFAQRNLRVGSTTIGDDNRIKNGYIGIESTGKIDQKIIGNFINNMEEAGIVAMNGNTRDIQIKQNEINHTKFGIHTIDMPFSTLIIKNNVIKNSVFQCSFPCLENIGIMVENVLSPDMKLDISNNDISKKRKGIYLRNVSTTDPALDMIENNIIDFPQLSSNGVGSSPYIGVELSGCKYVTVDENTITKPGTNPTFTMTTLAIGVKSTNSSDCIISNNIIKKMGSGVTAKDGNLNTVIVCNEYEKCYTGIDFVNAKINNHLPAPTNYSQRNKWINNFGPYKITGAIVSAPINFWYSSGLFQNPIPFNVSLTTFAINQPALSPSSFNVCGTLYAVPPNEERANKLEAVVLENDTTSIFEAEHKWQNKNYAYHKLKKNLNWLNLSQSDDVYYQSYLQLNQNQFVGKSFEVDSILQAEDLTNAKIMLSQLNPTNYMEENILKTDSIYFEYISDSTGIISNQIDFNFLNDLAFMDPLIAGPSVYSARVLLQLDPDDEMNSSRKYNSDENIEENTYFDFVVMPNPSDENTQIVFSELIEYKLFVYDIEGRLIQNLSGNSNRCYLSTIDLETGFYLIRIESKYGTKSSKISVVHH